MKSKIKRIIIILLAFCFLVSLTATAGSAACHSAHGINVAGGGGPGVFNGNHEVNKELKDEENRRAFNLPWSDVY